MAIIKFKGFDKLEKQLKEKMNKALLDKKLLGDVGEKLVDEIVASSRLGGARHSEKFAPLKKSTIKQRERLSGNLSSKVRKNMGDEAPKVLNAPGTSFSPKKSNMTLTGKTLEAIKYEVNSQKPLISIIAPGEHPGYVKKDGTSTKPVPFEDILKWNHEKRKVMNIKKDAKVINQIRNIVKRHLRRLLK